MRICRVILAAKGIMMVSVVAGMLEIAESPKHLSAAFVLKPASVLDLQCQHQEVL
jgi:hypothetical protein